jgi:hypothetical protein
MKVVPCRRNVPQSQVRADGRDWRPSGTLFAATYQAVCYRESCAVSCGAAGLPVTVAGKRQFSEAGYCT